MVSKKVGYDINALGQGMTIGADPVCCSAKFLFLLGIKSGKGNIKRN